MKYRVAVQHGDDGFCVEALGLPGCWSQGATETEALENIQDAIGEYLAVRDEMVRDGEMFEVDVS